MWFCGFEIKTQFQIHPRNSDPQKHLSNQTPKLLRKLIRKISLFFILMMALTYLFVNYTDTRGQVTGDCKITILQDNMGTPQSWSVILENQCDCVLMNIKLACKGFQSETKINPSTLYYDGDFCIINNLLPIYPRDRINFLYARLAGRYPFQLAGQTQACSWSNSCTFENLIPQISEKFESFIWIWVMKVYTNNNHFHCYEIVVLWYPIVTRYSNRVLKKIFKGLFGLQNSKKLDGLGMNNFLGLFGS